jgi:hypothetical protein
MRAVRSELRRPINRRASTQSMGRAHRDLFPPTRLPQIYWKNLLDLTVCKIANSDVDGGNSGIYLINLSDLSALQATSCLISTVCISIMRCVSSVWEMRTS